jgi:hypothetical protein
VQWFRGKFSTGFVLGEGKDFFFLGGGVLWGGSLGEILKQGGWIFLHDLKTRSETEFLNKQVFSSESKEQHLNLKQI